MNKKPAIELKIDNAWEVKRWGKIYTVTEHGFPLGHMFAPGDRVKIDGKVKVIKAAEPFFMMHKDERTNKAAMGWHFMLEN